MCSHTNCRNSGGGASRRCTRCFVVSYCDESCQRADWKNHKALCRAVFEAKSCAQCQMLPKPATPLHGDCLSSHNLEEAMDQLPALEGTVLVPIYHAPFSPIALNIIQQMHRPELCRTPGSGIDAIIVCVEKRRIHFGLWGADFTAWKLQHILNKGREECWVCKEVARDQLGCPRCNAEVCPGCWATLVRTTDGPVPCPGCRNIPRTI